MFPFFYTQAETVVVVVMTMMMISVYLVLPTKDQGSGARDLSKWMTNIYHSAKLGLSDYIKLATSDTFSPWSLVP